MNKKQMIKSYPWLKIDGSKATLLDLIPEGWHAIVLDMCNKIATQLDKWNIPREHYKVADAKEKWFTLSWFGYLSNDEHEPYNHPVDEDIMKITQDYELMSQKICMICGREKSAREIVCKECRDKIG